MTNYPFYQYQNNSLCCENVSLDQIAKKQGTPLYVYSYQSLVTQFKTLDDAFKNHDHLICYSVKANSNIAIMKTFFNLGAGADVVSAGELRRALSAGCDPQKIVFSGVGKTSEEIHYALGQGILQFNVESEMELHNIQRIAQFLDKRASIAIRVNPDVDPKTHPYISTGLKNNKFGVSHTQALELYLKAKDMSHIDIVGIDCHIGSQITEIEPFHDAMKKVAEIIDQLEKNHITLKYIDIGGGLGIRYHEETPRTPTEYASAILSALGKYNQTLILEPGRFLVGNSAVLLSKVLYHKENEDAQHFTIIDAAFNDLMRPMLYEAYHHVLPVTNHNRNAKPTTLVGPICESSDVFAQGRVMPLVLPTEVIAFMSAGAYGMSMSSTYNSRGRVAEILVKDKEFYVIKKPDRLEDFTHQESLPEFLKDIA